MALIETLPAETGGTEITRFNALRHGVLSRYTVLPWEDAAEYRALLEALAAKHAPDGPTEEHLVEELAGILWRKRRLRLRLPPIGAGSTARCRPTGDREGRVGASGRPRPDRACGRRHPGHPRRYPARYRGRRRGRGHDTARSPATQLEAEGCLRRGARR